MPASAGFPPRLDQVQIGRVFGLEDKLPTWVGQRKQEHVGGAVAIEIVHHCVDPRDPGVDPALDRAEKIDPVRDGATRVGFGEGVSVAGRKAPQT